MVWNEKYHNFCLSQNMWSGTINAFCFIYKQCKPNESTVIKFKAAKFQKYMMQTLGKEYHRTYIRKIIRQAVSKSEGLLVIQEDYGKGTYDILVHPLSFLTENKKPKKEPGLDENARNCMFSKQHKEKELEQQQQFIEKVDILLKKVGFKFDLDALLNIYRLSGKCIGNVAKAIELLLYRNQSKKIAKPHGFIIDCLKKRWAEGFDLYYEPELPTFSSKKDLRHFVYEITKSVVDEQKKQTPKPT